MPRRQERAKELIEMRNEISDLALLVLRVVVGGLFIGHGAQKLFGWFGGGGIDGTADSILDFVGGGGISSGSGERTPISTAGSTPAANGKIWGADWSVMISF